MNKLLAMAFQIVAAHPVCAWASPPRSSIKSLGGKLGPSPKLVMGYNGEFAVTGLHFKRPGFP